MSRIIFLDIDGVLNTPRLIGIYGKDFICDRKTERVDRLAALSKAQIVLSTSWVSTDGFDKTIGFLRKAGLKADIIGHTDQTIYASDAQQDCGEGDRYVQIMDFVHRHHLQDWIALDDLRLPHPRAIWIKDSIGLLDSDCQKAFEILCPPMVPCQIP